MIPAGTDAPGSKLELALNIRTITLAVSVLFLISARSAQALDLLGWKLFESSAKAQADQTIESVKYQVEIALAGGPASLANRLEEVSMLKALQPKGAADINVLVARARGDATRFKAALYEAGYYAGSIRTLIAGRMVDNAHTGNAVHDAGSALPVRIEVDPGPIFQFGGVEFSTTAPERVAPSMAPADYGLVAGQPAMSGLIVKAIERHLADWRIAGYPFARVANKKVVADHASRMVDVAVSIDTGRSANYGWLSISGATSIDSSLVARYSGLKSGRPYNPKDLKTAAERLRKLEAIDGVRFAQGEKIDSNGGIPIVVSISERKPRFVGASASVSSVDGAETQAYWGHRNLFGGAEMLRLEGGMSQIGSGGLPDLQYVARARLTKPAILSIDTDFVSEASLSREHPRTYESRWAIAKIGLAHRFSETLTGNLSFAARASEEGDAFGTTSYAIVSLPGEIVRDTRDNKLDATRGWRGTLSSEPAYDAAHNEAFLTGRTQLSSYLALDDERRIVIAGRIGGASIVGAGARNVPASLRLYAGGGGSVRGFAYRSIGSPAFGETLGGLALFEASAEVRWRLTSTIGIVPFIDLASVSEQSWPTFSSVRIGAGIGLRYYTSIGPIRFDVAVPIERGAGVSKVAFYVGLGQAF